MFKERCTSCNLLVNAESESVTHCPICEGRVIPCSNCQEPECCDDEFICTRFKIKIRED